MWLGLRETPIKIVKQPSADPTKRTAAHMSGINRQRTLSLGRIVLEGKSNEPARRNVRRDEIIRHAAPSEPGQQKIEPSP